MIRMHRGNNTNNISQYRENTLGNNMRLELHCWRLALSLAAFISAPDNFVSIHNAKFSIFQKFYRMPYVTICVRLNLR
jgi:hypothetical protein